MFPNNVELLGRLRDCERLQEAEHIRLVKIARPRMFNYRATARKTATWLGSHMIQLGSKLQGYGAVLLSKAASADASNV